VFADGGGEGWMRGLHDVVGDAWVIMGTMFGDVCAEYDGESGGVSRGWHKKNMRCKI